MNFIVIIPARLKSTRLPNKPLADIAGLPMVVRVARQAALSGAKRVIVATDDETILDACGQHGVECCMTSRDCACGTDRLSEVVSKLGLADDEIIVNVQGDEPLIPPEIISSVARILMDKPDCAIGTAALPIKSGEEFFNPNAVKVVLDGEKNALLFSRAPIPWDRDLFAGERDKACSLALRHVGIYSYRASFLKVFPNLKQPELEKIEKLEQLRALWHGYRIGVEVCGRALPPGVDTLEDLERVRKVFEGK